MRSAFIVIPFAASAWHAQNGLTIAPLLSEFFFAGGVILLAAAGHVLAQGAPPLWIESQWKSHVGDDAAFAQPGFLPLVSDGVVKAANAKGELFGFERTHDISTKPALDIAEAARAWGQNDDITVVTVRRAT